ncbi:MAG: hypothetical protein LBQ62_03440 [Candidatus Accumulibacter sp.]|jgi:uncharacterized membrane protein|nr:hypothetical protein [Accumulibacter sp.]
MSPFPIPAPGRDGRSRAVGADAVFIWLRFGWNLFLVNPVRWLVSMLTLTAAFIALMYMIGWAVLLLASLLAPILSAGLFAMCRKAADEGVFGLSDLAAGLTTRTAPLIVLGVIYLLAEVLVALAVLLPFTGHMGSATAGLAWIALMAGGVLVLALLAWLLFIPLCMVMWFAPALVLFNGMPPLRACRASFAACLKNILPFLILGLIVNILGFFAVLPAGLGYLVLIPVLAGTAYASYQDVFVFH